MANQLTTGVKITVDTSELDVKFLKTVDELNASLTKQQKALKLSYNEQGLLVNSLGQCVEGLSASNIKLGQYVDEMGRVHTVQGGFIEGLNRSQVLMGQYVDEMGNIHRATGEVIGQTKAAAAALDEVGGAAERAAKVEAATVASADESASALHNIRAGLDLILGADNPLSAMAATIDETANRAKMLNDAVKGLRTTSGNVEALTGALSDAKNAAESSADAIEDAGESAKSLGASLGAIAGPAAIAAGVIGAVYLAAKKYADAVDVNAKLSESFKEIEARAKKAGAAIKDLDDVLKFGAFQAPTAAIDEAAAAMDAAAKRLEAAQAAATAENKRLADQAAAGGMGAGGGRGAGLLGANIAAEAADAQAAYNNSLADYNAAAAALLETARAEDKTEREKLEELRRQYETLLERTKDEEAAALIRRQIGRIDADIAAAKESELDAANQQAAQERAALEAKLGVKLPTAAAPEIPAENYAERLQAAQEAFDAGKLNANELAAAKQQIKAAQEDAAAAEREAARATLEAAAGIKLDETQAPPDFNDKFQRIADALNSGVITAEEYSRAQAELAAQAQEASAQKLGLDQIAAEAAKIDAAGKTATQALEERAAAIEEARAREEITAEQYEKATADLAKIRENIADEEAKRAKEDAEKARTSTRAKLGIDALKESLKTPLEKYKETLKEIKQAAKEGAIGREERALLEEKAAQEYWKTIGGAGREIATAEQERADESTAEKAAGPAQSMSAGSAELYLAAVQNSTANYQTRIAATAERLHATANAALVQSQQTNYFLQTIATAQTPATFYGA